MLVRNFFAFWPTRSDLCLVYQNSMSQTIMPQGHPHHLLHEGPNLSSKHHCITPVTVRGIDPVISSLPPWRGQALWAQILWVFPMTAAASLRQCPSHSHALSRDDPADSREFHLRMKGDGPVICLPCQNQVRENARVRRKKQAALTSTQYLVCQSSQGTE